MPDNYRQLAVAAMPYSSLSFEPIGHFLNAVPPSKSKHALTLTLTLTAQAITCVSAVRSVRREGSDLGLTRTRECSGDALTQSGVTVSLRQAAAAAALRCAASQPARYARAQAVARRLDTTTALHWRRWRWRRRRGPLSPPSRNCRHRHLLFDKSQLLTSG